MASMNFQDFCEETNKVTLLPEKKTKTTYGDKYIFSPDFDADIGDIKTVNLHGLYFPNDREIRYFCEQKNLLYSMYEAILNDRNCLCNSFLKDFTNILNINFLEDPFEEVKEFLKQEKKRKVFTANVNELTEIIGRAYEKAGFLDSDIRITALIINPEINIIDKFKRIQIGYEGRGYRGEGVIISRKSKKNYFL